MSAARVTLCFLIVMAICLISQAAISIMPGAASQLIRKFYPSDDAVVYEGDPKRNFGFHWEIGVNYRADFRDRSFIMVDLSSIPPGSVIVSAVLNLYMYEAPTSNRSLACYEVAERWNELKITWSNQPGATVFVTSTSTGTKPKTLSLNVKSSIVKFTSGYLADYVPNNGWMLKDSEEESGSVDIPFWMISREHSDLNKRPYLEVKYYPPHLELELSSSSMEAGNWVKMRVHRKTNDGCPIDRGDLKVKLSSNSTSTIRKFSLTRGGDAITELTIPNDSSYMDFYYYDEKAGTWKITVMTDDYSDYVSDSKNLKVTPSQLDCFVFDTISSPKIIAVPFSITITACDVFGNIKTDYTGTNSLSDTTGTLNLESTGAFVKGKWTGNVVVNKIGNDIRITTSGGGKTGESNLFNVSTGPPTKLVIEPSNFTMAAGIVYSYLTISLRDANNFWTTNASDILVSLSTNSSTGEFRRSETDDKITSIIIPRGESSVKVDYYTTTVGAQTLTAWATGLTSGTATVIVVFDKNPPVTQIIVGDPKYQSNVTLYVSSLTTFMLSASDDASRIKEVRYRVGEESWKIYSTMFTLSAYSDGLYAIEYYSVDRAGNIENEKRMQVILDKIPPYIGDASPTGNLIISSASVVFTVNVTDAGSEVREVELFLDEASQGAMTKSRAKYTKTVNLSEGKHTWSIKAVDNVNNSATGSYSFTLTIDTVPPVVSELETASNPVFGEATTITCRASDRLSGVRVVYICYSADGGASWVKASMNPQGEIYSGSIPTQLFFTEVQYYIEAVDNAGNRYQTSVSKYRVGIPLWLYLAIIALAAILVISFLLRRFIRRRSAERLLESEIES